MKLAAWVNVLTYCGSFEYSCENSPGGLFCLKLEESTIKFKLFPPERKKPSKMRKYLYSFKVFGNLLKSAYRSKREFPINSLLTMGESELREAYGGSFSGLDRSYVSRAV